MALIVHTLIIWLLFLLQSSDSFPFSFLIPAPVWYFLFLLQSTIVLVPIKPYGSCSYSSWMVIVPTPVLYFLFLSNCVMALIPTTPKWLLFLLESKIVLVPFKPYGSCSSSTQKALFESVTSLWARLSVCGCLFCRLVRLSVVHS